MLNGGIFEVRQVMRGHLNWERTKKKSGGDEREKKASEGIAMLSFRKRGRLWRYIGNGEVSKNGKKV